MSDAPDTTQYSVADAPSVGADPNANPGSFKTPGNFIYQTISPSGGITKDQVFATETVDEVIPPDAIMNYDSYLALSNKVRPINTIAETDFSINQQYVDEAKKQFRLAARDESKRIKKTANSWIKYAENEAIRVQNLNLRREFIEKSNAKSKKS